MFLKTKRPEPINSINLALILKTKNEIFYSRSKASPIPLSNKHIGRAVQQYVALSHQLSLISQQGTYCRQLKLAEPSLELDVSFNIVVSLHRHKTIKYCEERNRKGKIEHIKFLPTKISVTRTCYMK